MPPLVTSSLNRAALQSKEACLRARSRLCSSASGNAASTREDDRPCSHRGWSDSERGEHSSGAFSNSHSSCGGGHGDECESDPAGHRKHQEKRRRFEARRRQHYNMRDALRWSGSSLRRAEAGLWAIIHSSSFTNWLHW